jgi:L-lactate dehydrogenase
MNTLKRHTVGVVGTGHVGMAAAYAMFQQRTVNELILIDFDKKRAEGESMDLMHSQGYVGRRRVRAGSYADLVEAQVIVISAGVGQKPGESRLQLLSRNAAIFRELAAELDHYAPHPSC